MGALPVSLLTWLRCPLPSPSPEACPPLAWFVCRPDDPSMLSWMYQCCRQGWVVRWAAAATAVGTAPPCRQLCSQVVARLWQVSPAQPAPSAALPRPCPQHTHGVGAALHLRPLGALLPVACGRRWQPRAAHRAPHL